MFNHEKQYRSLKVTVGTAKKSMAALLTTIGGNVALQIAAPQSP
ncbi:MAG: hypothetical protein WKF37_23085 [Bryobacteraceae bacterium]